MIFNKITTSDAKGNFKDYDLIELIKEFTEYAEELLINSTEKFIMTILKNGGDKKNKYIKRLDVIKSQKSGNLVIDSSDGSGNCIVIRIIN